jgi:hypothetical protein
VQWRRIEFGAQQSVEDAPERVYHVSGQDHTREIEMTNRTHFRIAGLPLTPFEPLFALADAELGRHGARRCIVDSKPGYPCRVSLVDAEPGERVILLPYPHHDVPSPYRASGPIYVREHACEAVPGIDEVPESVRSRLLSVRAYDETGFMVGAGVTEGRDLEDAVGQFFGDERVAYLHLHNARPGCYSCRVDRVTESPPSSSGR